MTHVDWVIDGPGGIARELAGRLAEHAVSVDVAAVVGGGCIIAAAVIGRTRVRRWQHRRMTVGARFVEIQSPPTVEPAGAAALWTNLHDLLRPAWRRVVHGQSHLAFEYHWTADGLRIGMWVPGVIPPGLVERAIGAAWPAATTTTSDAEQLALVSADAIATGGELRLAVGEWFRLRTDHDVDPLRQVIGAATTHAASEVAVVQVLVRPVTGRSVG